MTVPELGSGHFDKSCPNLALATICRVLSRSRISLAQFKLEYRWQGPTNNMAAVAGQLVWDILDATCSSVYHYSVIVPDFMFESRWIYRLVWWFTSDQGSILLRLGPRQIWTSFVQKFSTMDAFRYLCSELGVCSMGLCSPAHPPNINLMGNATEKLLAMLMSCTV